MSLRGNHRSRAYECICSISTPQEYPVMVLTANTPIRAARHFLDACAAQNLISIIWVCNNTSSTLLTYALQEDQVTNRHPLCLHTVPSLHPNPNGPLKDRVRLLSTGHHDHWNRIVPRQPARSSLRSLQ